MAATVTIDKVYFETLLRRYVNPTMIIIKQIHTLDGLTDRLGLNSLVS